MKELIKRLPNTVLKEQKQNYDKCYEAATALEAQAKQIKTLSKQLRQLAAALAAKDEALTLCDDHYFMRDCHREVVTEALTLQPHASLVAKIKADAVRRGLAEWESTTKPIYKFMHEYADRIEKGEA